MIAMLLYVIVLGGLAVLFAASVSALKDAVRQRARLRGFAIAVALAVGSLVGMWAVLV
jgi:hypothetical protein